MVADGAQVYTQKPIVDAVKATQDWQLQAPAHMQQPQKTRRTSPAGLASYLKASQALKRAIDSVDEVIAEATVEVAAARKRKEAAAAVAKLKREEEAEAARHQGQHNAMAARIQSLVRGRQGRIKSRHSMLLKQLEEMDHKKKKVIRQIRKEPSERRKSFSRMPKQ
jgi:hypothetical protein